MVARMDDETRARDKAYAVELANAAPPLTDEQRRRLREIFRGSGVTPRSRDASVTGEPPHPERG